jgi:hypothetical protein
MIEQVKNEIIIVAPHVDDEIIGCFSVLMNKKISPIIIYTENANDERRNEALLLKKYLDHIKIQLFSKNIPSNFISPVNTLYFPDPHFEIHPEHRRVGMIGEEILRSGVCKNIIFYSTIMNAPYIHEVENSNDKKKILNQVYKSQKSLWQFDAKYYLFEGFCKWII